MSVKQAQAEADKCIEVIKGLSPTYPVFFDMEEKKQINGLNTDTRTKMAIHLSPLLRAQVMASAARTGNSFLTAYAAFSPNTD